MSDTEKPIVLTTKQKYNLRLLVKELRSGKYKQGSGQLVVPGDSGLFYCCLGIACKVLKYKTEEIQQEFHLGLGDSAKNTFLSEEVATRFGFSVDQQKELAEMNDEGESFEQIADEIVRMFNLSPKGR